ncbi:hypothetical protein J6590_012916 [Homalodisca vitripennis]|nr:hypothetical protein J6590_012916 [Homalodisca vitripennis]
MRADEFPIAQRSSVLPAPIQKQTSLPADAPINNSTFLNRFTNFNNSERNGTVFPKMVLVVRPLRGMFLLFVNYNDFEPNSNYLKFGSFINVPQNHYEKRQKPPETSHRRQLRCITWNCGQCVVLVSRPWLATTQLVIAAGTGQDTAGPEVNVSVKVLSRLN